MSALRNEITVNFSDGKPAIMLRGLRYPDLMSVDGYLDTASFHTCLPLYDISRICELQSHLQRR
jgi:hypothetical protein